MIEIPPPRKRKPFSWPLVLRVGGRVLAGIGLTLVLALVFFPERHQTCGFCLPVATGGAFRFVRRITRNGGVQVDVAPNARGPWRTVPQNVAPADALRAFRSHVASGACRCKRHPSFDEWTDWLKSQVRPPAPAGGAAPKAGPGAAPTAGGAPVR